MAAIKVERSHGGRSPNSTYPLEDNNNPNNRDKVNVKRRNSKMTTSAMQKEGITALMLACQQGRTLEVQNILRKKKDAVREQTRSRKVALHYCAEGGSIGCLELIFDAAPALLNAQDEEGYTPLHLSVINGNSEAVRTLIDFKADVNCLDNEGHSLIHWATVCGELEILDILLNYGAPASTPDIHHAHPIHYAAQMCGAVQSDSRTARVQSTVYGVSPQKGLTILRRLLQHPVPVDVKDQDGRQPLLWAASAGSADAILALINAGAAVEAEDKDGLTALHCAASRGHVDCIENLIGLCGAEVDVIDNNGCTALFYAITLGHADCTELLLNFGAEPNRQDRKGRTPAHCGASKGQLETIKLFAKHGGNLWLRNVRGDLPLHEAILSRRKDLVMWLLSQRPETVNASNNDGRTPIHLAALNNNVEMVKILIDHNAEMNNLMRTGKGNAMTPLDAAIHRGNSVVAKFLQLHGSLPANSLNDASLPRRLNRTLDSQARTISSLRGSQLGSHNDFSPDQLIPHQDPMNQLHSFTSPELPPENQLASRTGVQSRVDQYASQVAETILKGPFMVSSTPIMDDGVQTDSSFYQRDIQVQVSEDFPNYDTEPVNNHRRSIRDANATLRSSTSSSSTKSGKKLRKKKSSLTNEQDNINASTESEPEHNIVRRSHSKGSIHSRKSKKSNSSSSTSPPGQSKEKPQDVAITEMQDPTMTTTTTTDSTTTTNSDHQQQAPQESTSQETSNESEKFSELENVGVGSSSPDIELHEEDLGIIEEDSPGESPTKTAARMVDETISKAQIEIEQQIIEETLTKSNLSLTYANGHRPSSGKSENEDYEVRPQSQASTGKRQTSARRSASAHSFRRSVGSAGSARLSSNGGNKGKISSFSRPGSMKSAKNQDGNKSETGTASRTESRSSNKKTSKIPTPIPSKKRFPSPVSFISNPSQDDVTDHEDMIAIESIQNELNLQEAAAARRRKSESKLIKSLSTPSTSAASSQNSTNKPIGVRKGSKYSSSGKSFSSRNGTRKGVVNGSTDGQTRLTTKSYSQVKAAESSNEEEIRLQEELLALSKNNNMTSSRIPKTQVPTGARVTTVQKANIRNNDKTQLKENEANILDGKNKIIIGKGGDSGYSDQMLHTTSASEDQAKLRRNKGQSSNGTGGLVVRRNRLRPGSSSSAKIIARQQRLVVSSPRKGGPRSNTSKDRKQYETTQKSILGELDDGLNGSVEDETTSHGGSGSLTSEEGYRRRQLSKRKMPSRTKFTFSNGRDVTSGRESPKLKNLDIETPISVTQAMQSSMRKYNLERKIFQELLELKRLQIRSGKANEQVLVKRLADGYKKEGLSINFREYDGPYTYMNFEKYLYDQLRLLQSNRKLLPRFAPSDDLEKLSSALKKMNATKLPYLLDDNIERSESTCDHTNCTHLTHRCHHAAHAYTGIPCAAYIGTSRKMGFLPQVDTHKAPGPIQKSTISPTYMHNNNYQNGITTKSFTPSPGIQMIVSPRRTDTQSPITLELQQGDKTQVFSLPSQTLDPTKNYYVSLSIKPSPSPPIPHENEDTDNNHHKTNNTTTNTTTTATTDQNIPNNKIQVSKANGVNQNKVSNNHNKNGAFNQNHDKNVDDSLGSLIIPPPSIKINNNTNGHTITKKKVAVN